MIKTFTFVSILSVASCAQPIVEVDPPVVDKEEIIEVVPEQPTFNCIKRLPNGDCPDPPSTEIPVPKQQEA